MHFVRCQPKSVAVVLSVAVVGHINTRLVVLSINTEKFMHVSFGVYVFMCVCVCGVVLFTFGFHHNFTQFAFDRNLNCFRMVCNIGVAHKYLQIDTTNGFSPSDPLTLYAREDSASFQTVSSERR